MAFTPDDSQLKALESWYQDDNPLYKEARHPVIKLAGEAGEILDLYGKHEYKPDFDWWRCKICRFMPEDKKRSDVDYFAYTCMNGKTHTPLVLDELGDYSYYLRILCWQKEVSFEHLCTQFDWNEFAEQDLLECLSLLSVYSSGILQGFVEETVPLNYLHTCAFYFLAILSKLNVTLKQVLDLNYKKLNSEATKHGWQAAR